MTVKIQSNLQTEIDALLPDNTLGEISAEDIRTITENIMDSLFNPTVEDSAANSILNAVKLTRTTTNGTPAIGIGVGLEFEVETAAGNNEIGAEVEIVATNVGSGTEAFDMVFKTMSGGATATEGMRIKANRNVEMNADLDVTGALTATSFAGNFTIGGHTVDDIDITSEASDAEDHLMTALAIKNRIEDYGYSTTTGDITQVIVSSTDTSITGGGTGATGNISFDLQVGTINGGTY